VDAITASVGSSCTTFSRRSDRVREADRRPFPAADVLEALPFELEVIAICAFTTSPPGAR
jgi:hypothetical protein